MRDNAGLRFVGSLGVAFCIVSAMLWFALEISGFADGEESRALETHEVTLLSDSERLDLQELLGEGRYALTLPVAPDPVTAPAPRIAARGFVRLDVSVDAAGTVADVRVIDADPPGIYDAQAVAEIRGRHYAPDVVDGMPVASRRLEIVDFTISPVADTAGGRE